MIIGLAGAAGAGKSTAADFLIYRYGYERVRFAGPLKAMLRAFLAETGVPKAEIARMIEGDLKQEPAAALAGVSPRHFMQTLGTEFGRDLIAPDFWTRAWTASAKAALARGAPGIVVEDCRFPNEVEAIRALGGRIIRILRPADALIDVGAHPSEGQVIAVDTTIHNDGPKRILETRLEGLVDRYSRLAA